MLARASLADFLAIPEERRFHELLAGEIVEKAAPSAEHGTTQLEVGSRLLGPFGRHPPAGGPGGWWFMTEVEILFGDDVCRPDVVGWRRVVSQDLYTAMGDYAGTEMVAADNRAVRDPLGEAIVRTARAAYNNPGQAAIGALQSVGNIGPGLVNLPIMATKLAAEGYLAIGNAAGLISNQTYENFRDVQPMQMHTWEPTNDAQRFGQYGTDALMLAAGGVSAWNQAGKVGAIAANGGVKIESLAANDVRFSQSTVSYNKVDRITGDKYTYDDLVQSMKTNGWKGDPVDVVKMPDGAFTSMDNTRISAAREAGVNVQGNVRGFNDPLPADMIANRRFGDATTWGEALTGRISNQTPPSFGNANPNGSPTFPRITGRP